MTGGGLAPIMNTKIPDHTSNWYNSARRAFINVHRFLIFLTVQHGRLAMYGSFEGGRNEAVRANEEAWYDPSPDGS